MKKSLAMFVMLCMWVTLAGAALAEGAGDALLAEVAGNGYKIVGFGPSTYAHTDGLENGAGYVLTVEVTKESEKSATYHPNLVYDGGEVGPAVRVFDIGVKMTMGFDPQDLDQTETVAVSKGGKIHYEYQIPEGKEPLQVVFYSEGHVVAAAFEVGALPEAEEA